MDEHVAEAGDLLPLDLRVRSSDIDGKLLDGLTDHLEVAENGVDSPAISAELLSRETDGVLTDRPDGIEDVLEVDPARLIHQAFCCDAR